MKLDNKVYDILKWVVILFLPALAVLYKTVADAIGLQYTDIVVTIINAIALFLGSITGISTYSYNKTNKEQ